MELNQNGVNLQGKFVEANRIMAVVAKMLPNVTPVTLDDLNLFSTFFQQEAQKGRETHGNGFSYMIQMMNNIGLEGQPKLGYKFYDGDNLLPLVIYPRRVGEGFALYFVRPMGKDPMAKIIELTKTLRTNSFEYPIYAKKIFEDQKQQLLSSGFSPIERMPWHTEAPSEDDTYPEQILDCDKIIDLLSNKKIASLESTNRGVSKLEKNNIITTGNDNFQQDAWNITLYFFNSIVPEDNKVNISSPQDYYNMIFNNPNKSELERKVIYINNEPVAYYIAEKLKNSNTINLYALITLRDKYRYLADYCLKHIALNNKSMYINLGGSEDPGINRFKTKFKPVKEVQMYWVVSI